MCMYSPDTANIKTYALAPDSNDASLEVWFTSDEPIIDLSDSFVKYFLINF